MNIKADSLLYKVTHKEWKWRDDWVLNACFTAVSVLAYFIATPNLHSLFTGSKIESC